MSPQAGQHRGRRQVVSFVRRGARMTGPQQRAWDTYRDRWLIEVPRGERNTSIRTDAQVELSAAFGRAAPLIVEIGPGMGDSLIPMAQRHPEANVLAVEVYDAAIGKILARIAEAELDNVRIIQADAIDALQTVISPAGLSELWMFFPDPWPKTRHHKRRLVNDSFVDLIASRMHSGGQLLLATDWEDYALQMRRILDTHPAFVNAYGTDWAPRPADRPVTRFEDRGIRAGRKIFDLNYRRI